jgi:AbrB family looped-hinge helix DNA binding protein
MSTKVTLDQAGRIVIPRAIRDELHIEPGDSLELESQNMALTLRPVRSESPLKQERGVWVFHSGNKLTADDTRKILKDVRNSDRQI